MEDSVPDVEDLCAELMAEVELLTEQVKAEGRNFNPSIEQIYYQRLAQSSGQAQVSVIRARMKFNRMLLDAPAPRVARPSPTLALAAPQFAPSTTSAVKAEADQSNANRADSSSSMSMDFYVDPGDAGVTLRNNTPSVVPPLHAPALVTPSDASKFAPSDAAFVKVEPTEAV